MERENWFTPASRYPEHRSIRSPTDSEAESPSTTKLRGRAAGQAKRRPGGATEIRPLLETAELTRTSS